MIFSDTFGALINILGQTGKHHFRNNISAITRTNYGSILLTYRFRKNLEKIRLFKRENRFSLLPTAHGFLSEKRASVIFASVSKIIA